ncbi:MAG: hypothetical protein ACRCWI_00945 [Brevinema sp.]
MELLAIFSIFLSTINFYFLFKNIARKPFQQDLTEFQSYTERMIVEFNRITTRNIELLDSRIEELNRNIRLSQKVDLLLKERFEEAQKIEYLKVLNLDKVYEEQNTIKHPKIDILIEDSIESSENTSQDYDLLEQLEPPKEIEDSLFEGIPITKIKKHHKNLTRKKRDLLKEGIKDNKSKEELLDLGFTINEINLAQICYTNEQEEK